MKIILASKSEVRRKILQKNKIDCEVIPSNIDEDQFKESLINEKATPEINKELAHSVNVKGLENLVKFSNVNTKIIHISSDYVFDGIKEPPALRKQFS